MGKEENSLKEAVDTIKHSWRHRTGQEIPAAILDTVDTLWKEDRKPLLTHKKKSSTGWHMIFTLPPGVSFAEVQRRQEYFSDACRGFVEIRKIGGYCHMNIVAGQLQNYYPYEWNPDLYGKMALPIPIGYSPTLQVLDLTEAPHLLVGGETGYGKSVFLTVLIHSLLPLAKVAIIDLKRLQFSYLKNHCVIAKKNDEAVTLLGSLNKEMDRRIDILEAAEVDKIQDFKGDMDYIVLVIDEVAEVQDERAISYLDRIVRLARATGISVVAATQRPSKKVKAFQGDIRDMFAARLSFLMADEVSSRVILGENCSLAAQLPAIKGRAIWKYGIDVKEVQCMLLEKKQAKKLLGGVSQDGWIIESRPRLPAR